MKYAFLADLLQISIESSLVNNLKQLAREKRFAVVQSDSTRKFNKGTITWRLLANHTFPGVTEQLQRSVLGEAVKYWSEVTPMCFKEDIIASQVDITFGFFEGKFGEIVYFCL